MKRRFSRNKPVTNLNLVALMDIITILVFFLMINSGEMQQILNIDERKLAKSSAVDDLKENLSITLTASHLYVAEEKIMTISQLKADTSPIIQPLINYLKKSDPKQFTAENKKPLSVTIYSDSSIPYSLLKKVFQTCAATPYRNIILGVQDKKA